MFRSRLATPLLLLVTLLAVTGCASNPPDNLAAKECKVVVADFPGKPAKSVTRAEQAGAEMQISRLAANRGDFGRGNNLLQDIARDCN